MQIQLNNEKGFTLAEVLVALTIFTVGLLGIASLQYKAMDFNRGANTRSVGIAVATMVLEDILSADDTAPQFSGGVVSGTTWDLDTGSAATSLEVAGSGIYNATYWIRADVPVNEVARVDVTVENSLGRKVTMTGFKRFQ